MSPRNKPITIAGNTLQPGERKTLHLDLARLYTNTHLDLDIEVIHGRRPGPTLMICAAIHGDELNGVEICRQLLKHKSLARIAGTLIIVPVVNIFGFIHRSRYLPDRRDLNRCFPGSEKGSLGGRIANIFRTQVLCHCTHVLDLHTGAIHRSNLPQIRANLDNPSAREMARAFGAPMIIDSKLRDGSLRQCADEAGIALILYEAGEALRFDPQAIKGGVRGAINIMRSLSMLTTPKRKQPPLTPVVANSSSWVRSQSDGVFRSIVDLGQRVSKGQLMGIVASPFGDQEVEVNAPSSGIIIGQNNIPLVNEGDALYHLARFDASLKAEKRVGLINEQIEALSLPEDFDLSQQDS
ncbi:succinylglutamate desuccinylase/aspartoacylase family protein [Motiliproteus sp. MSK22-1]|uniref:succinylglutamate desuccinylase/aspartoacylase family protein n=1 Tax=Motiliproteus sp. MSK22-1 TaxID=1897630 RepID=UPI0009786E9F|nr:succinylglutamate desuccinylase/aspartoacylase family protein [Motiliproteus sp. MSK22-1]OMH26264.1 succinylglutamate desuccinylase [Motiliproteus sp. MSK22-1]